MFMWLSMGEPDEARFEQIAWIKIVGLPIRHWSEPNFEKIIAKNGKILAPVDDFKHKVNLSCVKLGILTSRRTNINEEASIEIGGKFITIGIVEFENSFEFDDEK
ncbi:unnamed protein product [Lactuca virosa]|uniref:DUF4283 domain-containing protein n=1 Tax=Lactuca virosa TaxID=75947 RepID=A0AAU9NV93_9ASTR|nr:unnamed protein product [Lactuca virosa]